MMLAALYIIALSAFTVAAYEAVERTGQARRRLEALRRLHQR
jgi:hypothetical protein